VWADAILILRALIVPACAVPVLVGATDTMVFVVDILDVN